MNQIFLSYNSEDRPAVEKLADKLKAAGLDIWFDQWHLLPGVAWQPKLEQALLDSHTCLVCIGPKGIGQWQEMERQVAIDRAVKDKQFRVIPVLLPKTERGKRGDVPLFLQTVTWIEFRESVDEDAVFQRLLSGIHRHVIETRPKLLNPVGGPYLGLKTFHRADAPFFFGREALTEWLVSDVRRMIRSTTEPRFLAIVGASGSGKSSVARAGLLYALKEQGAIEGSESWSCIVIDHLGHDPIEALATQGCEALGFAPNNPKALNDDFIRPIATDPAQQNLLHLQAETVLANKPSHLLILIDQFEEILTECQDATLRQRFVELLLYAARAPRCRVIVVITLRADFIGKCAAIPGLDAAISQNMELVGPMTDEELAAAIVKPAELCGVKIAESLVGTLIKEVRKQPGSLPLLEHVLKELWRVKQQETEITDSDYTLGIGSIDGALSKRADELLQESGDDKQQKQILALLTRLVHISDPASPDTDTRARYSIGEADYQRLKPFVDAHLLVTSAPFAVNQTDSTPENHPARIIEVAHEALIREWPKLQEVLQHKRELLFWRQSINPRYEAWKDWTDDHAKPSTAKPADIYLEASDLKAGLAWLKQQPDEFDNEPAGEKAFILASHRRAQRQRLVWAVPASVVLMIMAFLVWINIQNYTFAVGRDYLLAQIGIYYFLQPEMVQVPPQNMLDEIGPSLLSFKMGSTDNKASQPVHEVRFAKPFMIGKYEVTFDEYDVFVLLLNQQHGDCPNNPDIPQSKRHIVDRPSDEAWGRGKRPAINVTWKDAVCYAAWLKEKTGKNYRLPSEAEWEYAARGNTQTAYWWGDDPRQDGRVWANCKGCGSQWDGKQTAPVGSFPANPFGLHDTAGNVDEWVLDCGHDDYQGAPSEGSVRNGGAACDRRVIRGGSWINKPDSLQSAYRSGLPIIFRNIYIGFRLAQDD